MDFLAALSAICGWVYTIMWSLSFYPQWILNARRRSTAGTTVDFPAVNCLGFLSYVISTLALRYSPTVRAEYAARHHGLTPTVALNDVVFAVHALVLCFVCVSQFYLPQMWGWNKNDYRDASGTGLLAEEHAYNGRPQQGNHRQSQKRILRAGNTRPSLFILGVMLGCVTSVVLIVLLVLRDDAASHGHTPFRGAQAMRAHMAAAAAAANNPDDGLVGDGTNKLAMWTTGRWTWLDVVYTLGYVKVLITLVKYSPQVLANYRNRSTVGWSIAQILLDFGGGVLSIAQLLLDSYRQQDWSGVTGNPVKLLLGNVSIGYDLIFFAQHYVLYQDGGNHDKKGDEEDNLGDQTISSTQQNTERERLLSRD